MRKYDLVNILNQDDSNISKKEDSKIIIYLLNAIIFELRFNLKKKTNDLLEDYSDVPEELLLSQEKLINKSEKLFNILKNLKYFVISLFVIYFLNIPKISSVIGNVFLLNKNVILGFFIGVLTGFIIPNILLRIIMNKVSDKNIEINEEIQTIRQPFFQEKALKLYKEEEEHLLQIYNFIVQYSSKFKLFRGYIPDDYIKFKELFWELDEDNLKLYIYYFNELFDLLEDVDNNDDDYNNILNSFEEKVDDKIIEFKTNNNTDKLLIIKNEELKQLPDILNMQRKEIINNYNAKHN